MRHGSKTLTRGATDAAMWMMALSKSPPLWEAATRTSEQLQTYKKMNILSLVGPLNENSRLPVCKSTSISYLQGHQHYILSLAALKTTMIGLKKNRQTGVFCFPI